MALAQEVLRRDLQQVHVVQPAASAVVVAERLEFEVGLGIIYSVKLR